MILVNASTLSFLSAFLNRSNRFQSHNYHTKIQGNTKKQQRGLRDLHGILSVQEEDIPRTVWRVFVMKVTVTKGENFEKVVKEAQIYLGSVFIEEMKKK